MMEQIAGERVAVDAASHSAFEHMRGRKPQLVLDDTVQRMRYLKTPEEIELTRQAAAYADYGLEIARAAVAEGLRGGITELEVVKVVQAQTIARMQAELEDLVNFYRGAVALTAHTGPRGALPHGHSGPHRIEPGHTLIVGIGVKVGGYHAESGCTFVVGEPTPDQRRCLEATWACDEAALAALRPGNTCQAVQRRRLGGAARVRLRRLHPPPHRARHGGGGARGALAVAGRRHRAGAHHGLFQRARHLPARDRRLPHHRLDGGDGDRRRAAQPLPQRTRAGRSRDSNG